MADTKDEALGIKGFKESNHYEQVRPNYPREAVEMLMNKLGLVGEKRDKTKQMTVLELGAGTGKFTRVMVDVLKDANVRIIASDPVKEMCDQFKKVLPDIEMMHFGAEDIALPDISVDAIVAAMSFHWFAYDKNSMAQLHRVLKPNGMLGVTWFYAAQHSQSYVRKVYEYLIPFFQKLHAARLFVALEEENIAKQIALSMKFDQPENVSFPTHYKCDREQFYQFTLSFSAVQAMNDKERTDYTKFCKQAMAEYVAESGSEISSLANRTVLYWSKKI